MQTQPIPGTPGTRRGFSLIELTVIVGILVLIISILIPALGGARDAARLAQTTAIASNLQTSMDQFRNDNGGRNPGVFSPREMGSSENQARGMSAMENIILDLAGQNAVLQDPADNDGNYVPVGPTASSEILVNPTLIGVGDNAYFNVAGEGFVEQFNDDTNGVQQAGDVALGHTRAAGDDMTRSIPDVVDAFGAPILAWVADKRSVTRVADAATFAAETSDGANRALFYWSSNSAFLDAGSLGKRGRDQTLNPTSGAATSLIGSGALAANTDNVLSTMRAVLGSPSAPSDINEADVANFFPTASRGDIVLHAAGRDGFYLGSKDDAVSQVTNNPLRLEYRSTFFATPDGDTRRRADDSTSTQLDLGSIFDDIIIGG